MAGTISISMTQQFDIYGKPLAGGQLYIIAVGTVSTPQDAFQDVGLTIKQPYPMTLDAAGRVPQFFLADGSVKIRLQDKNGVVQLASNNVLVIGPSSGGGGGGTVDPTQLIVTGNMILRYGVGTLAGYVRLNNLSIGSATSGATERANADTQALFQYLWNTDAFLTVSGGRGGSASADWNANKQLTLPDWRGYLFGALDDMGNGAANRLGAYFANATVLGATGGNPSWVLATANLPPYTPGGSVTNGAISTSISPNANMLSSSGLVQIGGGGSFFSYNVNTPLSASSTQGVSSFAGNAQGGSSAPFPTISPRKLCTVYLKL